MLSRTEISRRYHKAHPDRCIEADRRYREAHPDQTKEIYKRYRDKVRVEVLSHYSKGYPHCFACGERRLVCLSIDHVNGQGGIHRKSIKMTGGFRFYLWLRRNDYPGEYQVLCMNCQCVKKDENHEYRK